jgi:hypothetical protein
MKAIIATLITAVLLVFLSCNQGKKPVTIEKDMDKNHVVVVKEVVQAQSYTYMLVKEKFVEFWIATEKVISGVGDTLYYVDAFEMKEFHSKELERDFESIMFVNKISDKPIKKTEEWYNKNHNTKSTKGAKYNIELEVPEGAVSISGIYSQTESLKDKKVLVRGVVMKYNEKIMNKNWVHLQDGTDHEGSFDLTLTTQDVVHLGDTVLFEGVLKLDKDFGAGYVYPVIVEDAKLMVNLK